MVACSDGLRYLRRVASSLEVLLSHSLLDTVNLVLVPLPVPHSSLFSFLQGSLQSLSRNIFSSVHM